MNLNSLNKGTLAAKFLITILLTLLLVNTMLAVIISMHEKSVFLDEIRTKGNNTGKFLAGISAEPILSYNIAYLDNYVRVSTPVIRTSIMSLSRTRKEGS